MEEDRKIIIEAGNKFNANFKDSYGFLLMVYLNKEGLIHYKYNLSSTQPNVIETLDISSQATSLLISEMPEVCNKEAVTVSICFDEPEKSLEKAVNILFNNLTESKKANSATPDVLFEIQSMLSRVDFDNNTYGLEGILMDSLRRIQSRKLEGSRLSTTPHILPKEMLKLINSVAKYEEGVVFSPTPDVGSFALEACIPEDMYYAQDSFQENWAAGMILLNIVGYHPAVFENTSNWPSIKPSLIIATPRPHTTTSIEDHPYLPGIPNFESLEKAILRRGIKALRNNGKMLLTSTAEILNSFIEPEEDFFSYLERNGLNISDFEDDPRFTFDMHRKQEWLNYLEEVILLPKGLIDRPNTTQVLLVFDKSKMDGEPVKMVDASDYYTSTSKLNILKVDDLLNALETDDPMITCNASMEEIADNGYCINPALYVNSHRGRAIPKGSRVLRELVDIYEGAKPDSGNYLIIETGTRTPDGKSFTYELKQGSPIGILEKECIILNRIGTIRPVHYVPSNSEMIGYNYDSFAVIPHEDVDFNYLLAELNKPYVLQQVAAKQKGGNIIKMRPEEILRLRIFVPASIDEQRADFSNNEATRAREFSQRYAIELEFEYKEKMEQFVREMHLRKHTLNNLLNHFLPGLEILPALMEKENGVLNSDMVISPYSKVTVQQRLDSLCVQARHIAELVTKLTDDTLGNDKPEPNFDVISFINKFCSETPHDGYEFEFDWCESPVKSTINGDRQDVPTINMSKEDFHNAINNIIRNAVDHGFTDRTRMNYMIRFSTQTIVKNGKAFLGLKIANNGDPLPDGMTTEKVFQWGESESSNRSGIGGWQIANIAQKHGGYVKMNCYPEDEDGYTVEYELGFPVSNINTI